MEDTNATTPLDCHSVTKLVFGAENAPKKLLVTVCIHGNEICGLVATNELLQEGFFKQIPKDVRVTIMLGNPRAVMEDKRFIDMNLNRMFDPKWYDDELGAAHVDDPYERSLLSGIISEMNKCDAYLDLHSTSAPTLPFAILSPGSKSEALSRNFPVKFLLRNVGKVISGTSLDYVKGINKPGVCVECGQHRSEEAVKVAKDTIRAFITNIPADHFPKKLLFIDKSVILKEGFQFKKTAHAFDFINGNELVASDNYGDIRCPYKQGAFLVMPVAHPCLGEEAWLWGHTHELYNESDELIAA
jgi:predicted deacylase